MTLSALLMISAVTAAPGYQGVLLDFSATWCGPCQSVKPIVQRLERQGFPIRTVDIDKETALANRFHIHAVPTFVLVVNGKEVRRFSGPISESSMRGLMALIPAAALDKGAAAHPPRAAAVARNRAKESDPPESLYAAPKREADRAKRKRFQLPVSRDGANVAKRKSSGTVIRANNDAGDTRPTGTVPNDPMVASVRIRVRDSQGINYGSGTIIDSRAGRSLVLTCGHIFRGVPKNAVVDVDRFEGNKAVTYRGKIITYNLKADVGLASISTEEPLPTARIAPVNDGPQRGDSLVGIGCGGGKRPLKIPVRVTGVNLYLGPGNLECTRMPQQGRSGGGLFDQSGRLVGVCFAAEPRNRRGLYASLQPIHTLLKKAGVQIRYSAADSTDTRLADGGGRRAEGGSRSAEAGVPSSNTDRSGIRKNSDRFAVGDERLGSFTDAVATESPSEDPGTSERREVIRIDQRQLALMQVPLRRTGGQPARSDRLQPVDAGRRPGPAEAGHYELSGQPGNNNDRQSSGPFPETADSREPAENRGTSSGTPLKRIDDIFGKSGEAEVICVIRRLDDPRAPSKVVIINRASAKFVRYLQNETRLQPRKTARFVKQRSHESRKPPEGFTSPFRPAGNGQSPANEPARYRRSRATRLP